MNYDPVTGRHLKSQEPKPKKKRQPKTFLASSILQQQNGIKAVIPRQPTIRRPDAPTYSYGNSYGNDYPPQPYPGGGSGSDVPGNLTNYVTANPPTTDPGQVRHLSQGQWGQQILQILYQLVNSNHLAAVGQVYTRDVAQTVDGENVDMLIGGQRADGNSMVTAGVDFGFPAEQRYRLMNQAMEDIDGTLDRISGVTPSMVVQQTGTDMSPYQESGLNTYRAPISPDKVFASLCAKQPVTAYGRKYVPIKMVITQKHLNPAGGLDYKVLQSFSQDGGHMYGKSNKFANFLPGLLSSVSNAVASVTSAGVGIIDSVANSAKHVIPAMEGLATLA